MTLYKLTQDWRSKIAQLFREKALFDTASEKNVTIEAKFWYSEKQKALMRMTFGLFGPQNRHFQPKGTKRQKRPDWLAEDAVGSELLSAINRKINRKFFALAWSNAL